MDMIKPLRHCFFCKRKDKNLKQIPRRGIYGESSNFQFYSYHDQCLKIVLCEPEKHMKYVDLAIEITDLTKYWEKEQHSKIERAKKQCKYAKKLCKETTEI